VAQRIAQRHQAEVAPRVRAARPPPDGEHAQTLTSERLVLGERGARRPRIEAAQWHDLLRGALDEREALGVLAGHVVHALTSLDQLLARPARAQRAQIDAGAASALDESALGRAADELEVPCLGLLIFEVAVEHDRGEQRADRTERAQLAGRDPLR